MDALIGHMALGQTHLLSGFWTCGSIIHWLMWFPLEKIQLGQWLLFDFSICFPVLHLHVYLWFSLILLFLFVYHTCMGSKLPHCASCSARPVLLFLSRWLRFPHFWTDLSDHLFRYCIILSAKFSICCFCDVTENSHAVTLLQAWISLVIVKVFTFTFWDRAHPVHSLSCPPTHDPPAVDSPGLGLQVYHTQLFLSDCEYRNSSISIPSGSVSSVYSSPSFIPTPSPFIPCYFSLTIRHFV